MKPKLTKTKKGKSILSDWLTPTKSKKLKGRDWLIFAVAVALLWISNTMCSLIINYPRQVAYGIFGLTFLALVFFIKKRGLPELGKAINFWDEFFTNCFLAIICAFVSIFISAALLIPFNYYLIFSSKNQTELVKYFPVYSVVTHSGRRIYPGVRFEFNGRTEHLNGHRKIMDEMDKQPLSDFEVELTIRPGILHSFVVSSWDIIKKKSFN